jgi:hypothetical protein
MREGSISGRRFLRKAERARDRTNKQTCEDGNVTTTKPFHEIPEPSAPRRYGFKMKRVLMMPFFMNA